MADETNESFSKPLDKMTVKELREVALELPEITGVHGMNKGELLVKIKEVKGIVDEPVTEHSDTVGKVKSRIKSFKAKRQAALQENDAKMATIYKRRISRLKKKSRKVA